MSYKITFEKQTSKKSGKAYLCLKINGVVVTCDSNVLRDTFDLRSSELKELFHLPDGVIKAGEFND